MTMKKLLSIILTLVMMLSVFSLTGCTDSKSEETKEVSAKKEVEADTVKIGLIAPQTGPVAQYGIAVMNAVNLAVEEVNATDGINGKKVEIVVYDNKADATESINIFNRLVENDKIVALVGPVISSTSLAVAPIANEKGIPMITPTATSLEVTPGYDYVFRACYTDPYQGGTVAKYAVENLKSKKAAILYNSSDDYSAGVADAFKEVYEAAGSTITNFEGYTSDDVDFKAILTKVKENKPDVIFIPDYYNNVGLIAGQITEVGMQAQLLGADGWDGVQGDYADVVEGGIFCNHYAADDESAIVQDFVKAYTDKFNETPNALAALGYDGANTLLEAIKSAGSTDGKVILEKLNETDREGVTGKVTFDKDGNPVKSITMIKIENGKLKLEAKVGQ